jgi:hypothetical protein
MHLFFFSMSWQRVVMDAALVLHMAGVAVLNWCDAIEMYRRSVVMMSMTSW